MINHRGLVTMARTMPTTPIAAAVGTTRIGSKSVMSVSNADVTRSLVSDSIMSLLAVQSG